MLGSWLLTLPMALVLAAAFHLAARLMGITQ
jgi:hypothetical protein